MPQERLSSFFTSLKTTSKRLTCSNYQAPTEHLNLLLTSFAHLSLKTDFYSSSVVLQPISFPEQSPNAAFVFIINLLYDSFSSVWYCLEHIKDPPLYSDACVGHAHWRGLYELSPGLIVYLCSEAAQPFSWVFHADCVRWRSTLMAVFKEKEKRERNDPYIIFLGIKEWNDVSVRLVASSKIFATCQR